MRESDLALVGDRMRLAHHPESWARRMTEVTTVSTATVPRVRAAVGPIRDHRRAPHRRAGRRPGRIVLLARGSVRAGRGVDGVVQDTAARYADLEAQLIARHEWKNPEIRRSYYPPGEVSGLIKLTLAATREPRSSRARYRASRHS